VVAVPGINGPMTTELKKFFSDINTQQCYYSSFSPSSLLHTLKDE